MYIYMYITPFMIISHVSRKEMHTLIRSYFFDTAIYLNLILVCRSVLWI